MKLDILGQEYKFYTAASEEELQSILALVRQLVETGSNRSTGTLPVGKIAVMACLNIASKHVKLEREYEDYRREEQDRLMKLNEKIRSHLITD